MEKEKFEVVKIIPVNLIEDKKQMRLVVPSEIVEDFRIQPDRMKFAWIIEREVNSERITISGKFISKQNGKNKEGKD